MKKKITLTFKITTILLFIGFMVLIYNIRPIETISDVLQLVLISFGTAIIGNIFAFNLTDKKILL